MAKVKVWNDNVFEHTEKFKGAMITVPAGGSVEMDHEEAYEFVARYTGLPEPDFQGDIRRFHKKLRVEAGAHLVEVPKYVNQVTGKVYQTQAELDASLSVFKDRAVRDEDAERAAPARDLVAEKDAEIAALQARLAALEGNGEKRGPGRPKKAANG